MTTDCITDSCGPFDLTLSAIEDGDELLFYCTYNVDLLDETSRRQYDIYEGVETGAVIVALVEDGAANAAGLRVGEVVTKFDGVEIETVDDLVDAVKESEIGRVVKVVVVSNDGSIRNVRVELGFTEGAGG